MGIDAGFDMLPQLSKGVVDRQNWNSFIKVIKEVYENGDRVEAKANCILFKAGEHPRLPSEGHKFLRFSSKNSGSVTRYTGVERYIKAVASTAKLHFGSRVHYWNETWDQQGYYDWADVHESSRTHEQSDEPEIPTTIAGYVFGRDILKESDVPQFEIRQISSKGNGLVARFNIAKGARILIEKPLFTEPNMPPEMLQVAVVPKLKSLSRAEQRQFLSLHNNFPGKHPFSGITKMNALPRGSGSHIGGVYPTISLINHSCIPNTHNNWNDDSQHETIHAVRATALGEEITISYGEGSTATTRQAKLKNAFGFDCACSVCTRPVSELQASDARRSRIKLSDDAIGDATRMMFNPNAALADCCSLVQLLEEEDHSSAGALIARLYYDALQISIAHGD